MAGVLALVILALASGASAFNFTSIDVPGASLTAAQGVHNAGDISGWYEDANGTHGFLRDPNGTFSAIEVPGAQATLAFGLGRKPIAGAYSDGATLHGFLATP
jgi:hypothetical protein